MSRRAVPILGAVVQGPANPPDDRSGTPSRTWLSPRPTHGVERLAYAVVGTLLFLSFLAGLTLAVISWAMVAILPGLLGLGIGLLALTLGYRMLFAAAYGRRLYWWPGQREYDNRGAR